MLPRISDFSLEICWSSCYYFRKSEAHRYENELLIKKCDHLVYIRWYGNANDLVWSHLLFKSCPFYRSKQVTKPRKSYYTFDHCLRAYTLFYKRTNCNVCHDSLENQKSDVGIGFRGPKNLPVSIFISKYQFLKFTRIYV